MTLGHGSQLGPYEILTPIGAGGMGEVYKARDTRLDRTVAVKVLPEHLSKDPGLRERFEREARAVSSLNHPHICTLHDVGEHDGIHFLVMEYIKGETLADRLKKGALPLELALEYSVQIADALHNAHREGVVHRDIKPGNVMLTKPGIKLLDFGLAKTREEKIAPTGLSAEALAKAEDSEQPTQNKPLTAAGTILGTVQYMAPEQLEGKEADARADLFALGAVLYEMLTGRKAFEGSSQASLISAIMSSEPSPVSELQSMSPQSLDRVVKQCLAKDPEDRWHSAHDLADELKWISEGDATRPIVSQTSPNRGLYALGGVLALVVAAGVAFLGQTNATAPALSYRLSIDLPGDLLLTQGQASLALSPDGTVLVYGARTDGVVRLWQRKLTEFEARPIPGTEGAESAFFSPNGEWIGFFADGALRKLHLGHGAVQVISRVSATYPDASWGKDGNIFFSTDFRSGLMRVSADGGEPERLTTPDYANGEIGHGRPQLLPDEDSVLLTVFSGGGGRAAILSIATGVRKRLDELGALRKVHYLPTGHLAYVAEESGALTVVPFDLERLEPTGPAAMLGTEVLRSGSFGAFFAVSGSGTLAFVPASGSARGLAWVDRDGNVTHSADRVGIHPRYSPNGDRVAVDIRTAENTDIWIFEGHDAQTRLTTDGTNEFPVWSPDGRYVVFISTGSDLPHLSLERANGIGEATILRQNEVLVRPTSWSPDGRFLALEAQSNATGRDVWILPLEPSSGGLGFRVSGEPQHIHGSEFSEGGAVFSPDGRFLAYVSNETGQPEIYVESFPTLDDRIVASSDGGVEPMWSPDGRDLLYRLGESMFSVRVTTEPKLDSETPSFLFETFGNAASATHAHYDVSGDGNELVAQWGPPRTRRIHVVTNWFAEVERLAYEE